MSQERQVTVRVQKVKRNRIRMKLFLFAALAATLLLITIFAKYICPYDPYAQDLSQAMQPPSAAHLMGTDTYGNWSADQYFFYVCFGCNHYGVWNDSWNFLWLLWRSC